MPLPYKAFMTSALLIAALLGVATRSPLGRGTQARALLPMGAL